MHSHMKDLLRRLSDTDPDTACAVLRSLSFPLLSLGCMYQGLTLLYDILLHSVYAKARAAATEAYLAILDNAETIQEPDILNKETEPSTCALRSLVEWIPKDTTTEPSTVNLDLRMRGYNLFALCCNNLPISEELEVKIANWTGMLRIAGHSRSVRFP